MINLVAVMDGKPFTSTLAVASGVGHTHETVVRLLRNSMDLPQLSDLKSETVKTKGRPQELYWLDEEQATLLIMLMKNSPKVRIFKSKLASEFYKQRKLIEKVLTQKSNAEWLEKRQETKVMRRECTDIIQKFIAYAKEQGSKSAEKYYMNFSRMELSGLFILEGKYPNARDVMNMRQLNLIEMADEVIAQSLKESMGKKLPYKECYKEAKARIEQLAKILPKSPLPVLLGKIKL